ncbi:MAG: hypothetical protein ACM3NQ_12465 [Bacteroidales bacterium]
MINHPTHRLLLRVFLATALPLLAAAGCAPVKSRPGSPGKFQAQGDLVVSREQVRLRMRALVDPMAGRVEEAADAIMDGTADRAVQLAALEWKIQAVPALREALFQPDPFIATMDTWVLLYQMGDFFDHGPGKAGLGPASLQAAAACRALEADFTSVVRTAIQPGALAKAIEFASRWAAEHPITHSIAGREPALALAFEKELAGSMSVGDAVADATVTLDDLNRRIEIYSDQLFKQAGWEADRLSRKLMTDASAGQALTLADRAVTAAERAGTTLDRMAPSIEGAARTAERTPQIVASERAALVAALSAELSRTIEVAQHERVLAFEYLTSEREATLHDIRKIATEERQALARDAEEVSIRVVDHAIDRLERIVAAVIAVLLAGAFACLLAILFVRARHPPASLPASAGSGRV